MKICTVVLTYDTPLYNHFDSIKRKYLQNKNEPYYFVYNGIDESKNDLSKNSINFFSDVRHVSGIPVMFLKFIDLIEKQLLKDYDFVIRVNSSTFINIDIIRETLQRLDNKNIYMGYFHPQWNFVSGACTIFSQDVLNKLVEYKNSVNIFKEDDVVIGEILQKNNISKTYLDRYCLHELQQVPSYEIIKEALNYPQIRIWNPPNRDLIDVEIWNSIANILQIN